MDLSDAYCEPFVRFVDFENRFDDEFKIAEAAMNHLANSVTGPGGPTIMRGLMMDVPDLYREQETWTDPVGLLVRARANANLLGIVQIHSAIDDFLVQLDAENERWLSLTGQEHAAPHDEPVAEEDEEDVPPPRDKIELVCERLQLPVDDIVSMRPLLRAFRGVRNCVAHRSGFATEGVSALVGTQEVRDAIAAWPPPRRGNAPPLTLPTVMAGEPVRVEPRQVIFCLTLAHRTIAHVNASFVERIGVDGFVRLAARHSLLGGRRTGRNDTHRSVEALLNDLLGSRYKAREVTPEETIRLLRDAGIWDRCIDSYRRLYGAPQG